MVSEVDELNLWIGTEDIAVFGDAVILRIRLYTFSTNAMPNTSIVAIRTSLGMCTDACFTKGSSVSGVATFSYRTDFGSMQCLSITSIRILLLLSPDRYLIVKSNCASSATRRVSIVPSFPVVCT